MRKLDRDRLRGGAFLVALGLALGWGIAEGSWHPHGAPLWVVFGIVILVGGATLSLVIATANRSRAVRFMLAALAACWYASLLLLVFVRDARPATLWTAIGSLIALMVVGAVSPRTR